MVLGRFRESTAASWWFEVGPLLIAGNGEARLFGGGLLVPVNGDFDFGSCAFYSVSFSIQLKFRWNGGEDQWWASQWA